VDYLSSPPVILVPSKTNTQQGQLRANILQVPSRTNTLQGEPHLPPLFPKVPFLTFRLLVVNSPLLSNKEDLFSQVNSRFTSNKFPLSSSSRDINLL